MGHDDKPVTKGRRFLRLAGMTASVAGRYAGSRLKSMFQSPEQAARDRAAVNEQNGTRIAETLGELKGAVMKVGQMASIATDVLPRELAEPLKALQKQAPPMAYEVIAEQIVSELGSPPEMLFSRFERKPFASASIGQVHRARTDDGREVVVKVQYPGVDEAVDSDLAHLKLVLRASGLIKVPKQALDSMFAEIRARLHEELDYCNEADNVRAFRAQHAGDPTVVIPEVVGERSAQRVLTLTYEPGDGIDDLDVAGYPQDIRDRIGINLFQLFAAQLFDHHNLHADPNPGNIAFRPDGTIILYDYGCVKKVKPEIATAYLQTIEAGLREDYDRVERGLLALGVRNPDGPAVEHAFYKDWRDAFALPFLRSPVFEYAKSTMHEEVVKLVPGALKRMDSFQPPPELVFIDRAVAGHYGNLRKIRARSPVLRLIEPYLARVRP